MLSAIRLVRRQQYAGEGKLYLAIGGGLAYFFILISGLKFLENLLGPFSLGRQYKFRDMLTANCLCKNIASTFCTIPKTIPLFEGFHQLGHLRTGLFVEKPAIIFQITKIHSNIQLFLSAFEYLPGDRPCQICCFNQ